MAMSIRLPILKYPTADSMPAYSAIRKVLSSKAAMSQGKSMDITIQAALWDMQTIIRIF